jgi:hypothetical protein
VLRIGREIAEGLAAAHDKSLIHRDIKPANVWLEAGRGRVKILDFGLARAVGDETHLTQQGAIVGTPQYMAPEQCSGDAVDGRCDLFSLGCVLYRLCTGELPFKGKDLISILAAVALQQPKPPCELNPEVPPVLSALVIRLLAKAPADRPRSAGAVAEALQAIEHKQPAGFVSKTGKRTAASGAGPLLSTPPGVEQTALASSHGEAGESPPRRRTRWLPLAAVAAVLLIALSAGAVAYVIAHRKSQDTPAGPPEELPPGAALSPLALVSRPVGLVGVQGWTIETRGHRGVVRVTAYSADSQRLASGGEDGTVRIWEPVSGRLLRVLVGHARGVSSVAWSPDGKTLASGSEDNAVRLWKADSGRLLHTLARHTGAVRYLAWSPDGKTLASGGADGTVLLWDASGHPLATLKEPQGLLGPVSALAWRTDGQTVAALGANHTVCFWDVGSGALVGTSPALPGSGWFSPDARMLATRGDQTAVQIGETETGRVRGALVMLRPGQPGDFLAITPDGHYRGNAALDRDLVFIVQTEGGQEMLFADEFAQKHGWKNDPEQVQLTGK